MFDMPCVIFAGGKSSRMGQDKSQLPFGGHASLVEYQHARLAPLFRRVCISAKERDTFDFDAHVIPDTVETGIFAPTAGFVSVFEHLEDETIFALSVDTPFIDSEIIEALIDAASTEPYDAVIARSPTGAHPMCGVYRRSLLENFRRMLADDDHRLGQLLKRVRCAYVMFDDEAAFANLNHPHEYEAALARCAESDR